MPQMRAIINEASGDRALHTVLEMVPYPRVRDRSRVRRRNFRESAVMARSSRRNTASATSRSSRSPAPARTWHAVAGRAVDGRARRLEKLYDIYDVAVSHRVGQRDGRRDGGPRRRRQRRPGRGLRGQGREGQDRPRLGVGAASSSAWPCSSAVRSACSATTPLRPDDIPTRLMSQSVSATRRRARRPASAGRCRRGVGRDLAAQARRAARR